MLQNDLRVNGCAASRADLARIEEALSFLPPDCPRDRWVQIGQAIHAGLGDDGFDLWDHWSQGGGSYKASDAKDVWKSFRPGGGIGIGTLFHLSKEAGWTPANSGHQVKQSTSEYLYGKSSRDSSSHPYLTRKGLQHCHMVRRMEYRGHDCLVVPMYDPQGLMTGLQFIAPDKVFGPADHLRDKTLLGGSKKGLLPLGPTFRGASVVVICEGLATGDAIIEAAGLPLVVAFDKGSLKRVALEIKKLAAPGADLIIAADDDAPDPDGIEKAFQAAQACGGRVALPGLGRKADFWDVLQEKGADAVRDAINAAQAPEPTQERIEASQADADGDEYEETDDLRPTEYVIDGFLGCGVSYIAGAHGVGKSSLLVPLASIVTGELEGIFGVKACLQRRVIYFAEDPEQIDRVRYGLRKYCELKRNGRFFIRRTKRLGENALKALVSKLVREHTIAGPNGYQVRPLLVFDTLSASFELENENDNAEAAKYLAAIKESGAGAPIWVIGHIPKALLRADVDSMTGRGAGAWEGDAQGTAFIFGEANGPQNIRYMRTRKRRFEADYVEARFETSMRAETRVAAWGEEQTIIVRYGVPERGDEESRKQDVQTVIDEKKHQAVALAKERIRDFLRRQAAPVSKEDITAHVTELNSPRERVREAIQELERDGEVEVVEKYIAKDQKTRKNGYRLSSNLAGGV